MLDVFEQLLCDVVDAQVLGDVLLAGDLNSQGANFVDQGDQGQSPEGDLPSPAIPAGLCLRQSQGHGAIGQALSIWIKPA